MCLRWIFEILFLIHTPISRKWMQFSNEQYFPQVFNELAFSFLKNEDGKDEASMKIHTDFALVVAAHLESTVILQGNSAQSTAWQGSTVQQVLHYQCGQHSILKV